MCFLFLPTLSFFLLWKYLCFQEQKQNSTVKILAFGKTFLTASIYWGLAVVLSTEILSLFNFFTKEAVLVFWILCLFSIFGLLLKSKSLFHRTHLNFDFQGFPFLLVLLATVLFALLFISAAMSIPNNGDAINYHLPRAEHWVQNHSIRHYPTAYLRQLLFAPWTEYVIAHFLILVGSDYGLGFIQFFAFLGTIIALGSITQELQHKAYQSRAIIYSAFVFMTLPLAVVQASSVKNDLTVSFWLTATVFFIFRYKARVLKQDLLYASAALGLSLLTKNTAYLVALPLGLWLCWLVLKKWGGSAWKAYLLIFAVILSINAGYFFRNYVTFGTLVTIPDYTGIHLNEIYSPQIFLSNLIRQIANYFATPSDTLNSFIVKMIRQIHYALGVNPDDVQTTYAQKLFDISTFNASEVMIPSPFHFLLMTASFFFFIKKQKSYRPLIEYIVSLLAGFFLFALLMKWQPSLVRLQLPLLILSCPIIAIFLVEINHPKITYLFFSFFLLYAFSLAVANEIRPWIGKNSIFAQDRYDAYFNNSGERQTDYQKSAEWLDLKECQRIGFVFEGDTDGEYWWWVLLKKSNPNRILKHYAVKNTTNKISQQFVPDCLICQKCKSPMVDLLMETYPSHQSFNNLDVLSKQSSKT